jgi:alkane 1-monooxygenase
MELINEIEIEHMNETEIEHMNETEIEHMNETEIEHMNETEITNYKSIISTDSGKTNEECNELYANDDECTSSDSGTEAPVIGFFERVRKISACDSVGPSIKKILDYASIFKNDLSKQTLVKSFYYMITFLPYSIFLLYFLNFVKFDSIVLKVLPAFYIFVLMPMFDYAHPHDKYNLTKSEREKFDKNPINEYILHSWFPLQFFTNLVTLWFVSNYSFLFQSYDSIFDTCATLLNNFIMFVLLALNMGIISGMGAIISHELIHKHGLYHKVTGYLLLNFMNYGHFVLTHFHHHKYVCTNLDPSSAKRDESLYPFVWRSLVDNLKLVYNQQAMYKFYYNKFNYIMLGQLITTVCVGYLFGVSGMIFQLLQSAISVFFLEMFNYIEHYGLTRNENEPVQIHHSWNNYEYFSNYFLIKLQRHSDHHMYAQKPYYALKYLENSPVLPYSYPVMIILALFPNTYKKIMNPILDQVHETVQIK